MALQVRTTNLIHMRLRSGPTGTAVEFINACNGLNTTLSKDCRLQLQARIKRSVVSMLTDLLALASKGTLTSANGQDAIMIQALAQWLGDVGAANDVVSTIAIIT